MTSIKCCVTYSTLAIKTVITAVESYYDIGQVLHCQFWSHGLSDIYRLQASTGWYIFRISHHHWRSRCEIAFELEFVRFLRHHHLPVASPIPTSRGELYLEMSAPEGTRYGTLFEYAQGTVPIGDCDHSQSYQLGATLAHIHQISQSFVPTMERSPLTPEFLIDDSLAIITPFLEQRQEELDTLRHIATTAKDNLQTLPKIAPLWTVCWGDPHSGNAHFADDNHLTLFDFDQCGYGWRAFDIAKFQQVASQGGCPHSVRQSFLEGYCAIAPLKEMEYHTLPSLTVAAFIWTWAIHLNRAIYFQYSRLDDQYFTRRLRQLQQLHSARGLALQA